MDKSSIYTWNLCFFWKNVILNEFQPYANVVNVSIMNAHLLAIFFLISSVIVVVET